MPSESSLPFINCGYVYFQKISNYFSLFSFKQLNNCPGPVFFMEIFCLFEESFNLRNPLRRSLGKFDHIPKLYQNSNGVIYSIFLVLHNFLLLALAILLWVSPSLP